MVAQIYGYTDIWLHRYMVAQIYGYTDIWLHRYMVAQIYGYTDIGIRKSFKGGIFSFVLNIFSIEMVHWFSKYKNWVFSINSNFLNPKSWQSDDGVNIENRIYREEFNGKKV